MLSEVFFGVSVQLVMTWIAMGRADILYAENTDLSFDAWLADTKPGFTVTERNFNGRACFCRAPIPSTLLHGNYSSSIPPSGSLPSWYNLHSHSSTRSSFELVTLSTGASSHTGTTNVLTTGTSSQTETTTALTTLTTHHSGTSFAHSSFTSFDKFSFESLGLGQLSGHGGPCSSFDMLFFGSTSMASNADTTDRTTGKTFDANPQELLPTTMASSVCGPCNVTYVIGEDWIAHNVTWSSPGWDQGANYPDGCVCILTVKLQVMMSSVSFKFAKDSHIFALDNCSHDKLEVQIDQYHDIWCDYGIADKAEVMMTFDGTPKTATFTFTSDPTDGHTTEKGFQLILEPTLFNDN